MCGPGRHLHMYYLSSSPKPCDDKYDMRRDCRKESALIGLCEAPIIILMMIIIIMDRVARYLPQAVRIQQILAMCLWMHVRTGKYMHVCI